MVGLLSAYAVRAAAGVAAIQRRVDRMSMSAPVTALTFLGIIITVLGLFVGGGGQLIALGLGALVVAGILQVAADRRR
jgi:hypothetical protein